MQIRENISLKPYNTFGIDAKARWFAEAQTTEEIIAFLTGPDEPRHPLLILGGGSNVLFTKDFPGTVLKISTKGITVADENEDEVLVRANAGEQWDDLVRFCVEKGWGGLENMSLIPGNAGTSPVQNIGAYGVEIKDRLVELTSWDLQTNVKKIFTNEECRFGYRDSIFKTIYKGRYVILDVTFRLKKNPVLCLDYGNIKDELVAMNIEKPDIAAVREAVCTIRRRKLPDPLVAGNAGSFFKNPVIPESQFLELKEKFLAIVSFPQNDGIKLAAAWLIESCGWKGKREGDAGVHPNQPLVLVNYGNATGQEILQLSQEVKDSVYQKFGVLLETEVNVI
ncbi:MAG: UDP-N-acetylmuramate dehydrogenase [Bacteroidetes bacterium]|nr:UDP-N-acetylmuramate dehydrogenase [Bacteroidota bacterium]